MAEKQQSKKKKISVKTKNWTEPERKQGINKYRIISEVEELRDL